MLLALFFHVLLVVVGRGDVHQCVDLSLSVPIASIQQFFTTSLPGGVVGILYQRRRPTSIVLFQFPQSHPITQPRLIITHSISQYSIIIVHATLIVFLMGSIRELSPPPCSQKLDELDGHQAASCPKAGTPTW
jgi:hypothetical protein